KRVTAFVEAYGLAEVPLDAVEICQSPKRQDQAKWVSEHLGNPNPFLAVGDAFDELSTLGKRQSQPRMGQHGGECHQTKALASQIAFKTLDVLPAKLRALSIVAQGETRGAEPPVCADS